MGFNSGFKGLNSGRNYQGILSRNLSLISLKIPNIYSKKFPISTQFFPQDQRPNLTPIRKSRNSNWSSGIKFEGVKNLHHVGIPIAEIKR